LITLLKRMLLLLLLPSVLALKQGGPIVDTVDPGDPIEYCVDINCYGPLTWIDNKEQICRSKKEKKCTPKSETVCMEVPETECKVVGYTECDWIKTPKPARDDKVVGEYFTEKECKTYTIEIHENKQMPKCINKTKEVCEELWIPKPPFWEEVNCKNMTWQDCTLETVWKPVWIPYCSCRDNDIWYNKFQRVESLCEEWTFSCVVKKVPVCETKPVERCTTVSWKECTETCEDDCSMMHFKEPSQDPDHRRWCTHAEIDVPPGVNVSTRSGQKITNEVTNSDIVSNQKSKTETSVSDSKAATTPSNQRSERTHNPDNLSGPLFFPRSPPASNQKPS